MSQAWNWAVREKMKERPGIPEAVVSSKQGSQSSGGHLQSDKGLRVSSQTENIVGARRKQAELSFECS